MPKVDYRKLNSAQFFALRDVILDGFSEDELNDVLRKANRRPLKTLVADKSLEFMVSDLIELLRRRGWLEKFVEALRQSSDNLAVQDIESTLSMFDVEGDLLLIGRSLERTVREESDVQDFAPWVKELS